MKVIHFIYSLDPGGAERLVVDLSNEMVQLNHEVNLCTLRDDKISNQGFYKKELNDKVNYFNLKLPEGLRISNIIVIYNLIKKVNPEIIHCHQNLVFYIFPLYFFFRKKIFFYTTHTDPLRENRNKKEFFIRKFFYKRKRFMPITISKETSNSFENFYSLKKYIEIINGRKTPSQTNEFDTVVNYFNLLRKKFHTIFIHVARYAPVKNQKMLINVFNRLIKEDLGICLLVIGADFDSKEGELLKELAHNNILFLGAKHNIADYYLNADAFCLSSSKEGMPISLIEALACGCTPICTPVGGIVNTIQDGKNGYLSKSVNTDDYYDALKKFIHNKHKINKNELIDYFKSLYDINNCAKNYIAAYNKMFCKSKFI